MIRLSACRAMLAGVALMTLLSGCGTTESVAPVKRAASVERGYYKIGQPYQIDGLTYTPAEDWNYDETGIASWYGPNFHGKRTANGEMYNQNELTGAHRTLPMPSLVRVTNLDNGRTIIVRVNDRGPFARGRILDMSRRSAQLLGFQKVGTAKVRVQILAQESQALAAAAKTGVLALNLPGIDPLAPLPGATPGAPAPQITANTPRAQMPAPWPAAPQIGVKPLAPPPINPQLALAPPSVMPPSVAPGIAVPLVDEKKELAADVSAPIPGKSVGGRFMPAPQVGQLTVMPTKIYIQAGSFSVMENAERARAQLSAIAQANISPATLNGKPFYRVRIGPITSVDQADQLLARVVAGGARDARIIVD